MSTERWKARTPLSLAYDAAALNRAPAEVADFLVPLWATSELGASPAQVGAVVAVEATLSLVTRPLAGIAADRWDRARVAAAGAVLYALSLAGYACATNLTVAFAAAALGGVGGALFWVAVRARVGETGGVAAYGQLLAAEGQGAFIGFIGAFVVLGWLGYPAVFGLGAVAALAAAVVLLSSPAAPPPRTAGRSRGLRRAGRRLGPLLALTAITATAEAGVSLLLLLHLQRELQLEPFDIAMVFAPGFLVFVFLAGHTHQATARLGRGVTLALALTGSAATAAGLAFATDQWVIAGIWAVACIGFAAAVPVQEATVAEASGDDLGRGMGLFEGAQLIGALIGPAMFGALYGASGGWRTACLLAAAVLVAGALFAPLVIRLLGLPGHPAPTPREEALRPAGERPTSPDAAAAPSGEQRTPADRDGEADRPTITVPDLDHARQERRRWSQHLTLFAVGQAVFWVLGDSWIAAQLSGDVPEDMSGLMTASRIWVTILVVDFIWSFSYTLWPRRRRVDDPTTSQPASR
jgi:MFS family permease